MEEVNPAEVNVRPDEREKEEPENAPREAAMQGLNVCEPCLPSTYDKEADGRRLTRLKPGTGMRGHQLKQAPGEKGAREADEAESAVDEP